MHILQALTQWIDEKYCTGCWNDFTTRTVRIWAKSFTRFLKEHYQCSQLDQINRKVLQQYRSDFLKQQSLHWQRHIISHLSNFFAWACRHSLLLVSPVADWKRIGYIKPAQRLFSFSQIETILAAIDISTPRGILDRTLIETLYATAIRRGELWHLVLSDLDIAKGRLYIHGKGGKERIVPITRSALAWLRIYLKDARPYLAKDLHTDALFLNSCGRPYAIGPLAKLMKQLRQKTGINPLTAHMFRHSCATHLMQAGVSLRYIQLFLGHSYITSTQQYLHVINQEMMVKYDLAHPRDQLKIDS